MVFLSTLGKEDSVKLGYFNSKMVHSIETETLNFKGHIQCTKNPLATHPRASSCNPMLYLASAKMDPFRI